MPPKKKNVPPEEGVEPRKWKGYTKNRHRENYLRAIDERLTGSAASPSRGTASSTRSSTSGTSKPGYASSSRGKTSTPRTPSASSHTAFRSGVSSSSRSSFDSSKSGSGYRSSAHSIRRAAEVVSFRGGGGESKEKADSPESAKKDRPPSNLENNNSPKPQTSSDSSPADGAPNTSASSMVARIRQAREESKRAHPRSEKDSQKRGEDDTSSQDSQEALNQAAKGGSARDEIEKKTSLMMAHIKQGREQKKQASSRRSIVQGSHVKEQVESSSAPPDGNSRQQQAPNEGHEQPTETNEQPTETNEQPPEANEQTPEANEQTSETNEHADKLQEPTPPDIKEGTSSVNKEEESRAEPVELDDEKVDNSRAEIDSDDDDSDDDEDTKQSSYNSNDTTDDKITKALKSAEQQVQKNRRSNQKIKQEDQNEIQFDSVYERVEDSYKRQIQELIDQNWQKCTSDDAQKALTELNQQFQDVKWVYNELYEQIKPYFNDEDAIYEDPSGELLNNRGRLIHLFVEDIKSGDIIYNDKQEEDLWKMIRSVDDLLECYEKEWLSFRHSQDTFEEDYQQQLQDDDLLKKRYFLLMQTFKEFDTRELYFIVSKIIIDSLSAYIKLYYDHVVKGFDKNQQTLKALKDADTSFLEAMCHDQPGLKWDSVMCWSNIEHFEYALDNLDQQADQLNLNKKQFDPFKEPLKRQYREVKDQYDVDLTQIECHNKFLRYYELFKQKYNQLESWTKELHDSSVTTARRAEINQLVNDMIQQDVPSLKKGYDELAQAGNQLSTHDQYALAEMTYSVVTEQAEAVKQLLHAKQQEQQKAHRQSLNKLSSKLRGVPVSKLTSMGAKPQQALTKKPQPSQPMSSTTVRLPGLEKTKQTLQDRKQKTVNVWHKQHEIACEKMQETLQKMQETQQLKRKQTELSDQIFQVKDEYEDLETDQWARLSEQIYSNKPVSALSNFSRVDRSIEFDSWEPVASDTPYYQTRLASYQKWDDLMDKLYESGHAFQQASQKIAYMAQYNEAKQALAGLSRNMGSLTADTDEQRIQQVEQAIQGFYDLNLVPLDRDWQHLSENQKTSLYEYHPDELKAEYKSIKDQYFERSHARSAAQNITRETIAFCARTEESIRGELELLEQKLTSSKVNVTFSKLTKWQAELQDIRENLSELKSKTDMLQDLCQNNSTDKQYFSSAEIQQINLIAYDRLEHQLEQLADTIKTQQKSYLQQPPKPSTRIQPQQQSHINQHHQSHSVQQSHIPDYQGKVGKKDDQLKEQYQALDRQLMDNQGEEDHAQRRIEDYDHQIQANHQAQQKLQQQIEKVNQQLADESAKKYESRKPKLRMPKFKAGWPKLRKAKQPQANSYSQITDQFAKSGQSQGDKTKEREQLAQEDEQAARQEQMQRSQQKQQARNQQQRDRLSKAQSLLGSPPKSSIKNPRQAAQITTEAKVSDSQGIKQYSGHVTHREQRLSELKDDYAQQHQEAVQNQQQLDSQITQLDEQIEQNKQNQDKLNQEYNEILQWQEQETQRQREQEEDAQRQKEKEKEAQRQREQEQREQEQKRLKQEDEQAQQREARQEQERQEQERQEQERQEQERQEQERQEQERQEQERQEQERQEQERQEQERQEQERQEQERQEQMRRSQQKQQARNQQQRDRLSKAQSLLGSPPQSSIKNPRQAAQITTEAKVSDSQGIKRYSGNVTTRKQSELKDDYKQQYQEAVQNQQQLDSQITQLDEQIEQNKQNQDKLNQEYNEILQWQEQETQRQREQEEDAQRQKEKEKEAQRQREQEQREQEQREQEQREQEQREQEQREQEQREQEQREQEQQYQQQETEHIHLSAETQGKVDHNYFIDLLHKDTPEGLFYYDPMAASVIDRCEVTYNKGQSTEVFTHDETIESKNQKKDNIVNAEGGLEGISKYAITHKIPEYSKGQQTAPSTMEYDVNQNRCDGHSYAKSRKGLNQDLLSYIYELALLGCRQVNVNHIQTKDGEQASQRLRQQACEWFKEFGIHVVNSEATHDAFFKSSHLRAQPQSAETIKQNATARYHQLWYQNIANLHEQFVYDINKLHQNRHLQSYTIFQNHSSKQNAQQPLLDAQQPISDPHKALGQDIKHKRLRYCLSFNHEDANGQQQSNKTHASPDVQCDIDKKHNQITYTINTAERQAIQSIADMISQQRQTHPDAEINIQLGSQVDQANLDEVFQSSSVNLSTLLPSQPQPRSVQRNQ